MTDIYQPSEEDRDTEAEELMQMGKGESLRDPWFKSDYEAENWEPKEGGE